MMRCFGVAGLWVVGCLVAGGGGAAEPVLIHRFPLGDAAGKGGLRLADLDGDGRAEVIMARQIGGGHNIPCTVARLSVFDLDGSSRWRRGELGGVWMSYSDVPLQVEDVDGDGRLEIVTVMFTEQAAAEVATKKGLAKEDHQRLGKEILILDGRTGEVERRVALPDPFAHDSVAMADLDGVGHRANIILKDRYKTCWALNADLTVRFKFTGNVGHFVRPYDLDGDGRDELLAGYQCLNADGSVRWSLRDGLGRGERLGAHADAIWVGEIDGRPDNGPEIVMADESASGWMFDREGRKRWRYTPPADQAILGHSQHVVAGDFRPDLAGLEVAFYSRDTGHVVLLGADGSLIAQRGGSSRIAIIDRVRNWAGDGRDLVVLFRDDSRPVSLLDGALEVVASIPRTADSRRARPQDESFVLTADLCGDAATEVLLYDEQEVMIYSHGAGSITDHLDRGQPAAHQPNWTCYIGGVD